MSYYKGYTIRLDYSCCNRDNYLCYGLIDDFKRYLYTIMLTLFRTDGPDSPISWTLKSRCTDHVSQNIL